MARPDRNNILNGPLLPGIIRYSIPLMLIGILQLLFNAADLVVVGRYCGSICVAAVGATGAITQLIVNLFIGISAGAGVTVAQAIGAKDDEMVRRAVHTAIPTALIGGVVLMAVGIPLAPTLLTWMDTPESVLPLSSTYMRIYFSGMIFNMLYNFSASILRAAGDTRTPLRHLTIAGVLNVLLNLFFVIVLDMDVAGVALATILSQGYSAVALLLVLGGRTDACRIYIGRIRLYKAPLLKMLRIGIPAGIQASIYSIANVLLQSSYNGFGDIAMRGISAARNIEGFIYAAINSFNQATINFVGQNVGAKQYRRVKKVYWTSLACSSGLGILLGGIAILLSRSLLSIYITDSPEAIAYGMERMLIMCSTYFLCGLLDVTNGAIRGTGVSVPPMVVSIVGIIALRIGWVLTVFQIPAYHTLPILYAAVPVSWLGTFALQCIVFAWVCRNKLQPIPEEAAN